MHGSVFVRAPLLCVHARVHVNDAMHMHVHMLGV